MHLSSMVETASPFISAATPPPVTIPRMDEIHSSIKTRLKEAAKVVQELAPLYKLIGDFHKSLETSKKIGEQVAQKFVEIGLSRVNSDWGQSYVTIGELQHNLNKNMELWISTIKAINSIHLHKAAERDKEDIHVCVKSIRGALSSLEALEGMSGDRRSQSNVNIKELRNQVERKKIELFSEIDIMENGKCGSLAQKWVEVMAHQPFSPNTSVLDKFSKMKRIPSRSFSVADNPLTTRGLEAIISPRSFERSISFSHVNALPGPVPLGSAAPVSTSPNKRGLSHTVSQTTFPSNYSPNAFQTPLGLSSAGSREFKMNIIPTSTPPANTVNASAPIPIPSPAPAPTAVTPTPGSQLSFKSILGKLGKSISPSSPRAAQPMDISKEDVASKSLSTPNISTASATTTKPKHSIGTLKKRRHTIVTPPDLVKEIAAAAAAAPDAPLAMCPKRNFCYRQEEVC